MLIFAIVHKLLVWFGTFGWQLDLTEGNNNSYLLEKSNFDPLERELISYDMSRECYKSKQK